MLPGERSARMNNRTSTEIAKCAMEEGRTTEDYITQKRARSGVMAVRLMAWKNEWDVVVRQRGTRVYVYRAGENMDDLPERNRSKRTTRVTTIYDQFLMSKEPIRAIVGTNAQQVVYDYHSFSSLNSRRGSLIQVKLRGNTIILKRK